jgi:hypothetical protein
MTLARILTRPSITSRVCTLSALSVLAAALALGACATTTTGNEASAEPAKVDAPAAVVASAGPKTASVELAYFSNRGDDAKISSITTVVEDFNTLLVYASATGPKEAQKIVQSTAKYLGTQPELLSPDFGLPEILLQTGNEIWGVDRESGHIGRYTLYRYRALEDIELPGVKNVRAATIATSEGNVAGTDVVVVHGDAAAAKLSVATVRFIKKAPVVEMLDLVLPPGFDPAAPVSVTLHPADSEIWLSNGKTIHVYGRDGNYKKALAQTFADNIVAMGVRACSRGEQLGYWVIAHEATSSPARFSVLDRTTHELVGTIEAPEAKGVNSMQFLTAKSALFPTGSITFSQPNGIGAIDWKSTAGKLGLRAQCF